MKSNDNASLAGLAPFAGIAVLLAIGYIVLPVLAAITADPKISMLASLFGMK